MDIFHQFIPFLESLYGSPIPPMMLIWGIILTFLAAGGHVAGIIAPRKWRWLFLIIGLILLGLSLRIYVRPISPEINSTTSADLRIIDILG